MSKESLLLPSLLANGSRRLTQVISGVDLCGIPPALFEPSLLFAAKSVRAMQLLGQIEGRHFDSQISRLIAAAEPYLVVYFHDWSRQHASEFPKTLGEMRRLMVRSGFSAETAFTGSWRIDEVLPAIEGYLLRLQDQQTGNTESSGRLVATRNRNRHADAEQFVSRFVERMRSRYRELVPLVIAGDGGAFREFAAIFGPTAMANRFADGAEAEAKRIKTAIQKTAIYKLKIAPLFKKPPMQPHGEGDLFGGTDTANHSTTSLSDILRNMRRKTENRR